MPSGDPTFDDEQVRAIFAAAADRQSRAERGASVAGGGHTLEELKRIGAEAGIDPTHVEAAARSLVRRSGRLPASRGGYGVVEVDRSIPSRLDDTAWETTVRHLRHAFGATGVTSSYGGVREWISSATGPSSAPVEVRVEPEGDGVRLSLRRDLAPYGQVGTAFGLAFTGLAALLAVLLVVGTFETGLFALPAYFFAIGIASLLGARALAPRIERHERERLARCLDRIELIARGEGEDVDEMAR